MFRRHEQIETQNGVSRRLFLVFVLASIATLVYLNSVSVAELKLVAEEFPEWSENVRDALLHGYKLGVSLFLFFIDIILVGPFAYLSYFSQHIKPKPIGFINKLSFFDLGLLLALWFTLSLSSIHFIVLDLVSETPRHIAKPETVIIAISVSLFVWMALLAFKVHSYTLAQRKELKKYLIKL